MQILEFSEGGNGFNNEKKEIIESKNIFSFRKFSISYSCNQTLSLKEKVQSGLQITLFVAQNNF